MILDPDFPDHWKVRMLVAMLGDDELAPMYVIRLWCHCQNRRSVRFEGMTPMALKGVCRFKGDAEALSQGMEQSGFIAWEDGALSVLKWEEYNKGIIANWTNGGKGGRPSTPKKEPAKPKPIPEMGSRGSNPSGTQNGKWVNGGETHLENGLQGQEPIAGNCVDGLERQEPCSVDRSSVELLGADSNKLNPSAPNAHSAPAEADGVPAESRKPSNPSKSSRLAGIVAQVIEHWTLAHKHRGPKAIPADSKEYRQISRLVDAGYTADDLCVGIDGMHATPHNQGQNDRNTKYLTLAICFESASQLQRFIDNAEAPAPTPFEASVDKIQRTIAEDGERLQNRFNQRTEVCPPKLRTIEAHALLPPSTRPH